MKRENEDAEINVLIVDHEQTQKSVQQKIGGELRFKITAVSPLDDTVITKTTDSNPDIILVGISFKVDSFGIIKKLSSVFPLVPIMAISSCTKENTVINAIVSGASSYVLKCELFENIQKVIITCIEGHSVLSPPIASKVTQYIQKQHLSLCPTKVYSLTRREKQILKHIVAGENYKMIGNGLNISYDAVRFHIKNVYEKLEVSSLTQVVTKAIRENIV